MILPADATPVFTSNAVVLGILLVILAAVFITSNSDHPFWQKFYTFVPPLLLCYFIPSLLNSAGLISSESSNLYFVASRYLLPSSLVLLTLSVDFKGIIGLGPKAIIMFLAGSTGIIIGGPLAIIIVSWFAPHLVAGTGPQAVWRGLSTIAGSWIGGGANQTAMYEVFNPSDNLFSAMITVDIIVSNFWLAFLLYGAGISERIDRWFNADSTPIFKLRDKIENYKAGIAKIPSLADLTAICAVAFGITALGHLGADAIAPWISNHAPELSKLNLDSKFFWIVVIATTGGLLASFTPARKLEGAGASKIGSLFLYILVATIGMKMNILAIFHSPGFFVIGLIWLCIHVIVLISVGKMVNAPFFFLAVGSQANIGGAASAPIVASAFDSALAPVGVLLAVLGYVLGTYGAYICAQLMRIVS
ncbi:MAG TPA: DUF819 family protein [Balneolaceae bacterium]|nr:DUF819 family protein [Balneolaceae bacterium]